MILGLGLYDGSYFAAIAQALAFITTLNVLQVHNAMDEVIVQ